LACSLSFLLSPLGAQTGVSRLVKVSGDGQLKQVFNTFTQPLVVQAIDSLGRPIAGLQVSWTDAGGINYASPRVVTTDANGLASLQFVPNGDFGPGIAYRTAVVVASSTVGSAVFTVVSYPVLSGPFNPQPDVLFLKPPQENRTYTAKAGVTLADAVRVQVVTNGGNGVSAGQPIPGVGVTVRAANLDPTKGPTASCEGGTVITTGEGLASCNLVIQGLPGTTDLTIDVGSLVTQSAKLTVLPPDAAFTIVQGNNQSVAPGATLPVELVARLTDPAGTVLPNIPVEWSVIPAGTLTLVSPSATSSAAGLVSTGVRAGNNPGLFQVRATVGGSSVSFSVTVLGANPTFVITTSALPSGTSGFPYTQTISATGGVPPYTWSVDPGSIVVQTLPVGMTLSSGGVLAGQPTSAGTFVFSARVTDSTGATTARSFNLVIAPNVVIITASPLPAAPVGAAYTQQLAASYGTPPYSYTLSAGALPPGLSLSPTGSISGTPTTLGTYTFSVRVADSLSASSTSLITINVTPNTNPTRYGIISQIASGGGWKSTINLLNPNNSPGLVRILLTASDGTPLSLPAQITQNGGIVSQIGSTLERTVPAYGSIQVETEALLAGTAVGWAEVQSTVPVSGYAIFRQRGGDGRDSEGTSPMETRTRPILIVPYDNTSGFATGAAVVNLASAPVLVTLIARDDRGVEILRDSIALSANGHTSFSIPDKYPGLSGLLGQIELQSPNVAGISALGLRFSPTLSFTSIPVVARP
jgi:hypothetical protein